MNKEKLISYLYQEMSAPDRRSIEDNAEQMEEIKELRSVRAFLQSDPDVRPGSEPIFIKPKRRIILSKWWAIAASLALLLTAGKIFDIRIEKKPNQVSIAFGEKVSDEHNESAQYEMVLAAMRSMQNDLNRRMDGLQQVAYRPPVRQQSASPEVDYQKSMVALKKLLEKENSLFAEQLTQQIQQDQQAYTLEVVNTLLDYWDGQRKQDLQVVNNGLQNLAQTIQLNSDEFAQFTNQSVQNY